MTEIVRAVLDFEREHPSRVIGRAKARAIRERFGFSAAFYSSYLIRALQDPESDDLAPDLIAARADQVARLRLLASYTRTEGAA